MSNIDAINEAAEKYACIKIGFAEIDRADKSVLKNYLLDFIKYDAAKQYWFKQFEAEQSAGVWVKASERLPDKRVICRWFHSGNPDWERIDILGREQIVHPDRRNYDIECLDETPQKQLSNKD